MEPRDVVARLALLLFPFEGELDDASIAARHGERYEPDERQRMLARYRVDQGLREISASHGRTPLAVAWQLLDSPSRPVKVSRKVLQAARRRARVDLVDVG